MVGGLQPPRDFETRRTVLRPVVRTDAEVIFRGYSNSPAATRFMNFRRHESLEEAVQFAERCARCWQDHSAYPWAVISKAGGEFMGVVELRVNPPQADFGYIFGERFWAQGFATEAATPIVDWAYGQPEIFRVWATCHPDNIRSVRVLEKLGLALEARLGNWEARPQLGEQAGPGLMFAKLRATTKG